MVRVVPLHASPALGTFALGRSAAARDRVAHPDVLSGIRLLV
jgi:hypothetical protein